MSNPFHTPFLRKPKFSNQPFHPSTRGDISHALRTGSSLSIVAPQSPRPTEMLAGYVIDAAGVDLTASDLAFNDLLVSKAYESDPHMQKTSYEIPLQECLRFLGAEVRADDVTASLRRMEKVRLTFSGGDGRDYKNVQMLTTWERIKGPEVAIGYQFPDPIRSLMRHMPRYGYIELAAVAEGNMKSKFSNAVYKFLVSEVAKRPWKESSDNRFTVSLSPEALADLVGFPKINGEVPFAKLRERVISKLESDLSAVRKFDVKVTFDGRETPVRGRGKSVELVDFVVTVNADYHRTTSGKRHMTPEVAEALKNVRFGAPDAPELRLDSSFWTRVTRRFKSLVLTEASVHWVWIVALQEAIDGTPFSENYETRRFRGQRLIDAIADKGVYEAAWQFFAEEASLGADIVRSPKLYDALPKAKKAQLDRYRASKAKKPEVSSVPAAVVVATEPEVQKTQMPEIVASAPPTGPEVVPFEDCTHIELLLDDLEATVIDDVVLPKIANRVWGQGKPRILRVKFYASGAWQSLEQLVTPEDEDEVYQQIKRAKIELFLDGAPQFLRIA